MKLAVLGATGSVGRELVTQALAAGHEVSALVREQPKPGELDDRVASGLAWTLVRGPVVFTDGPHTGTYHAGPITPHTSPRISRGDLADFMLATSTKGDFVRMKPLVSK